MSKQEVILCEGLDSSLTRAIEKCPHDKLFILTDEHTHRLCLPQLSGIPALKEAEEIIIGAERERSYPPFPAHQPRRRNGDRSWWLRRLYL